MRYPTERLKKQSFNPHLHVGGDSVKNTTRHYYKVSIHTSTWEVTCYRLRLFSRKACFNPHLHVGGDYV